MRCNFILIEKSGIYSGPRRLVAFIARGEFVYLVCFNLFDAASHICTLLCCLIWISFFFFFNLEVFSVT